MERLHVVCTTRNPRPVVPAAHHGLREFGAPAGLYGDPRAATMERGRTFHDARLGRDRSRTVSRDLAEAVRLAIGFESQLEESSASGRGRA
ncbi:MAG: hypothetical protein K0S82_104 [Gaiellaceae bacterium]|jgi:hypothetical protein|nr:hypothetical protein [Gaiellaceae bacterium]